VVSEPEPDKVAEGISKLTRSCKRPYVYFSDFSKVAALNIDWTCTASRSLPLLCQGVWIMKPVGKARGRGIFLFTRLNQISEWKKDHRWKVENPQV
jgi:hypothetical protein